MKNNQLSVRMHGKPIGILAGVQQKICVVIDHLNSAKAPIGLPHRGTISTHILKPEIPNFPNSAFNKHSIKQ